MSGRPTPNLDLCPYLQLPNGGFRVRLLDPIGDQIGELDCETEEDAIAISHVRPLLFETAPVDQEQLDRTLAAVNRAGATVSNARFVRGLEARRTG